MTTPTELEAALVKILTAPDDARRALIARLGGPADEGEVDGVWPPPDDAPIVGADWTTIKGAVHESGWSETTIRKYRRLIGTRRFGQWYINRSRLARVLPKPRITSQ